MKLLKRRYFLWSLLFIALSAILQIFRKLDSLLPKPLLNHRFVRPPGAGNEQEFLGKCIRCRACANVCQAGCINFFSLSEGLSYAGTPYLNTRLRSCNLCMNCTQICPTGALEPIARDLKEISQKVDMGVAKVIDSNCLSFNGRICGICHDACPLKGKAIKLKTRARPVVIEEDCIGCGRCEERCPQTPAAILIYPKDVQDA